MTEKETEIYMAKFDTVQKCCTDPIPASILQSFIEFREVFKYASYDVKYHLYKKYYHNLAVKHRRSIFKVNPPFTLAWFRTEDTYLELYVEATKLTERLREDYEKKILDIPMPSLGIGIRPLRILRRSQCPIRR